MRCKEKRGVVRFSLRLQEKSKVIARSITEDLKLEAKERVFKMQNVSNKEPKQDLTELFARFMLKNETSVSAENFEKIIPNYDGKNMPVEKWFDNFEQNAEAYDLSEKQKYVHARNKMTGLTQLFLESVVVSDFKKLKEELFSEFHKKLDSAQIHEKLQKKKKQDKETFHEYVLNMRKIAAVGDIEESAVIKYIVGGLSVEKSAKYI